MISSASLYPSRLAISADAPPLELGHIGGRIVDQPAPELDALGIEQAHAIAAARTRRAPRGLPRAAGCGLSCAARPPRPRSTASAPAGRSAKAIQCLSALEPRARRHDQRAAFALRIERRARSCRARAPARSSPRFRRAPPGARRLQLRRHPAGAERSRALGDQPLHLGLGIGDERNQPRVGDACADRRSARRQRRSGSPASAPAPESRPATRACHCRRSESPRPRRCRSR